MNNIIIELCAEDRARLDRLTEALEKRNCSDCVHSALKSITEAYSQNAVKEPAVEFAQASDHPIESVERFETPTPVDVEPVIENKPDVKMTDIQQKVVALSTAGKKAEVRAIVNEYAERVTLIPEDKFVEVFERLTALEG